MTKINSLIIFVAIHLILASCSINPDKQMEYEDKKETAAIIDGMLDNGGETLNDDNSICFQLFKSYEVDTSGLRKRFKVVEGTPFVYFSQMYGYNSWEGILNSLNNIRIEYNDFDFNFDDFPDNYFIVTFGRELIDIQRVGEIHYGQTFVSVTFDEEYHGDTMFIYLMDKILFHVGSAHEYYIMNGEEKVFLGHGLSDLNDTIDWRNSYD